MRQAPFLALALLAASLSAPIAAYAAGSSAAGSFDEGEKLFRENKPEAAAAALEKAILEPSVDERAWLYLALSYQQLGKLDQASATLRKGLPQAQRFKSLFYYDLGNVFVLQGKNSFAVDMFGQAIGLDDGYSSAYLNRANARVAVKDYAAARDDYKKYLELEPSSSQRANIEALIAKLDAGIEEVAKQAAAEEAKRQAEEAARKDLLDKMAASLKAAADETTSISAGAGQVQGYGDELKLDE